MILQGSTKVLIVRFSSLGDVLLTTPIIRCIKLQSGAEVHVLVKKKFASALESNPHIDHLISIDQDWREVEAELRAAGYDIVVDLHKNLRSKRLIRYLKCPSVDFDKLNVEKWIWTTTGVNWMPEKHLVDRYFEALGKFGIANDGQGLEFRIDHLGSGISDRYSLPNEFAVLALGAQHFTKQIPNPLIEELVSGTPIPVVFIGGADVLGKAEELRLERYQNCYNLVDKTSFAESAELIHMSQFVITGDTSMMHLAAALKKETIVVWGSTHPQLGMYPYYGSSKIRTINIRHQNLRCQPCTKIGRKACPKGHFKCMLDLSSNDIIQAMNELLSRNL